MVYKVNHRLLTAEVSECSQINPSEICGKQNGTGTGFLRVILLSPDSITPPLLHIPSPIAIPEARVCSQTNPSEIYGKQNGTGTGSLRVIRLSPNSIIPPFLHIPSPVTVAV
jgi:hypothetical protein